MNGSLFESDLHMACQVLFGPEVRVTRDFFHYLQLEGVKAAFRRRARETHPDSICHYGDGARENSIDFHQVTTAYQTLSSYIRQRRAKPAPPPTTDHSGLSEPQSCRTESSMSYYFQGVCPLRPLEIGRFLYYRGLIPYKALIAAIVWQRNQRPPLGFIARKWGWLTTEDVQKIIRTRDHRGHFGEKAVRHGLITAEQLAALLAHQRSRQKKIGWFFVQEGYLTPQRLGQLLREQQQHNARYAHRRGQGGDLDIP